jgi:L-fuconolactonase
MLPFPIVDSHVHLYDVGRLRYPWLAGVPQINHSHLPADFTRACGRVAVDKIVFVEVDVDLPQQAEEADFVAEQAAGDPRVQGMVAAAPLEKGAAAEADLARLASHGILRGVRRLIQTQGDPEFCVRPAFIEGVKLLPKHALTFDICVLHHQLANAIRLVRQCPDVQFVLDHIGKPGIKPGLTEPWRRELSEMATLPNVVCKISGVTTEADHRHWTREQLRPYVEHVIDAFGFDRLMYGGDWPVSELAGTYPQWVETLAWIVEGCSDAEKRKLFRDTAIRVYRLPAG